MLLNRIRTKIHNLRSDYKDKYLKSLKEHKVSKLIIWSILLFLGLFIIDYIIYRYTNYAFIYRILINKSVIGWISGIGSLSAALVALYNTRTKPASLVFGGYCDSQHKELIVQIINKTNTVDFVCLKNVFFSDIKDKAHYYGQPLMIPNAIRKYEIYHPIAASSHVFVMVMKEQDIKKLLQKFIASSKRYLIFKFTELNGKEIMSISFSRKDLLSYDITTYRPRIKISTYVTSNKK